MKNTNAIHSLGNGSFLIYEQGPNIISMHAGDYSSPSIAGIETDNCIGYDIPSRKLGTWSCRALTSEGSINFTDTLDPYSNTFIRETDSDCRAELSFRFHPNCGIIENEGEITAVLPKGTMYFTNVVTGREYRIYVSCRGNASFSDGKIHIDKGHGTVIIRALRLDTDNAASPVTDTGTDDIRRNSDEYWEKFFRRIIKYPGISDAEESVAYTIKTQQSRDGGVMAGHFYPMAYVRDQAGTARGLIKLGLVGEAKKIVEFWNSKFSIYGDIHNAETMGNNDGRLVFSNDEVEVPAYVMLTGFSCAEADNDTEWLKQFGKMFAYASFAQCRHLVKGMTGFSGDETYIAGGMFPRCFLYHGSAESTMLFIRSIEKYIGYFGYDEKLYTALEEAKNSFRDNFVIGGRLCANQPLREKYASLPRFHFGYCDYCELAKKPAPLTWLERRGDGLYVSPEYLNGPEIEIPERKPLMLGSVSLSVFWHGFDILTDEEKRETVRPFLEQFEKRGNVYSSPDGDTATGYDYAYILEALVSMNSPYADKMLTKTLEALDESGSWSEYYRNGIPYNCRNRPWESAINISAVIDAVTSKPVNNR